MTAERGLAAFLPLLILACGPIAGRDTQPDAKTPMVLEEDEDRDGHKAGSGGDCDDHAAEVHPGKIETCNGIDDDCSGKRDEPFDLDLDGRTTCAGDCDDTDKTVYTGAPEELNGRDDDCDGTADNHRVDYDDDQDDFSELQGDCDDDEPLINPSAVDVPTRMDGTPELIDNDCDGEVDEPEPPCDAALDRDDPMSYARAMDLCRWVSSAAISPSSAPGARNIVPSFGLTYVPVAGGLMSAIGTGIVGIPPVSAQTGTDLENSAPHPDPKPDPLDGCGKADPETVNDYIELRFEIDVPSNAKAFAFDFNFMSTEYPEWVCTAFDDTFIAYLTSSSFSGNVSFDAMGKPVTINIGFFTVCVAGSEPPDKPSGACTGAAPLRGTGYGNGKGGGTGWLTTTAPVTPGERITLQFIIFDEGDHIYDSIVLLDNFRWEADPVDGPITIPRLTPGSGSESGSGSPER